MMKAATIGIVLCLCVTGCAAPWPSHKAESSQEVLGYIQRHLPNVTSWKETASWRKDLAGHYSSCGPQKKKAIGGSLAGFELYLFPDGTYFCSLWGDLQKEEVVDKGTWCYSHGLVLLQSDKTLSKDHSGDTTYVPIICDIGPRPSTLLMGTEWDYSLFIEFSAHDIKYEDGDEPDTHKSTLLTCSLEREEAITTENADALKLKLQKTKVVDDRRRSLDKTK